MLDMLYCFELNKKVDKIFLFLTVMYSRISNLYKLLDTFPPQPVPKSSDNYFMMMPGMSSTTKSNDITNDLVGFISSLHSINGTLNRTFLSQITKAISDAINDLINIKNLTKDLIKNGNTDQIKYVNAIYSNFLSYNLSRNLLNCIQ